MENIILCVYILYIVIKMSGIFIVETIKNIKDAIIPPFPFINTTLEQIQINTGPAILSMYTLSREEMIEFLQPYIFINNVKYHVVDTDTEGIIKIMELNLLMPYQHYRYHGHYDFYTDVTPVIPPETDTCIETPLW